MLRYHSNNPPSKAGFLNRKYETYNSNDNGLGLQSLQLQAAIDFCSHQGTTYS